MVFFQAAKRVFVLIFFIFSLISCDEENKAQIAGDLIQSFGASCSSYGSWSKVASKNTQSLIHQYEQLKHNDSCAEFSKDLEALNQLATSIHNVYSDQGYINYRQTQEELQELALASSSAVDPVLIDALKEEMISRQVDLARLRAEDTVSGISQDKVGYQDRYSVYTNELNQQFESMFMKTQSLSACLQQSPGAVVTLYSSIVSIAGSFVSPIVGTNMHILSGMMASLMRFLRQNKLNKAIWELYEAQMPTAVTCSLELMSNFTCQAEDAADIIKLQVEHISNPSLPSDFWQGINIINTHLPVINDWILKVKSGTEPQNKEDADRKNVVLEKRHLLDSKTSLVRSLFNEYERRIERTKDTNIQQELLVDMIDTISTSLAPFNGHVSQNDPFYEFRSNAFDFACYLVFGVVSDCDYDMQGENLKAYILRSVATNPRTPKTIRDIYWPQIYNNVKSKVDIEFDEVIFVGSRRLMAKAHEDTLGEVSPREALMLINEFLINFKQRSEADHSTRIPIITERILEIKTVIEIMDNYEGYYANKIKCDNNLSEDEDECDELRNPLREIYEIFRLTQGESYFNEMLFDFVNWDLNDRIKNDEIPEDIKKIIFQASSEMFRRLIAAGHDNYYNIMRDLDTARIESEANINSFRKFMFDSLPKMIKSLSDKAKENGETNEDAFNRKYSQQLAHLCTMIFVTGQDWPDKSSKKICNRSVLMSPNVGLDRELSIKISSLRGELEKIKKPVQRKKARSCIYYNFLRANRIAEVMAKALPRKGAGELLESLYLNLESVNP